MKDTCSKECCPWWKKYEKTCPMYIETTWEDTEQIGTSKTVSDCAPKRNAVMLMEYSARAVGMQQDYEQQRNKYDKLINNLAEVVVELEKNNQKQRKKLLE